MPRALRHSREVPSLGGLVNRQQTGVPLLWPFDATDVTLPHGTYLLVLAVVAGVAAARPWLPVPITVGRSRAGRRPGRSATP